MTDSTETAHRAAITFGVGALFVLGLAALMYAGQALLLLFGGVLLGILLRGLGRLLSARLPGSTELYVGVTIGAIILLIVAGLVLAAPEVSRQLGQLTADLPNTIAEAARGAERSVPQAGGGIAGILDDPETQKRVAQRALGFASTTIGAFASILIVAFIGIYTALEPGAYMRGALALLPEEKRERASQIFHAVGDTLFAWFLARLFAMALVGMLTWIGLRLLDMPYAIALAMIAGVLDFIPNIGPVIAGMPAVLLALPDGLERSLLVAGVYLTVQTLESYIITPLIQQRAIALPAALIVAGQVFLGVIGGLVGIALATPLIAACLVTVRMAYVEDVLDSSAPRPGEFPEVDPSADQAA